MFNYLILKFNFINTRGDSIFAHSRPDKIGTARFLLLYITVFVTQKMQTLLKNLFNLINYWKYIFSFYSLKYSKNHQLKVH
jgi:hypothetical protein